MPGRASTAGQPPVVVHHRRRRSRRRPCAAPSSKARVRVRSHRGRRDDEHLDAAVRSRAGTAISSARSPSTRTTPCPAAPSPTGASADRRWAPRPIDRRADERDACPTRPSVATGAEEPAPLLRVTARGDERRELRGGGQERGGVADVAELLEHDRQLDRRRADAAESASAMASPGQSRAAEVSTGRAGRGPRRPPSAGTTPGTPSPAPRPRLLLGGPAGPSSNSKSTPCASVVRLYIQARENCVIESARSILEVNTCRPSTASGSSTSGTYIAGPFCATVLGEFGADVIKVERPGTGDHLRRFGTETDVRRHAGLAEREPQQALGHASTSAPERGRELLRELVADRRRRDRELPARGARALGPRLRVDQGAEPAGDPRAGLRLRADRPEHATSPASPASPTASRASRTWPASPTGRRSRPAPRRWPTT